MKYLKFLDVKSQSLKKAKFGSGQFARYNAEGLLSCLFRKGVILLELQSQGNAGKQPAFPRYGRPDRAMTES